MNCPNCGNPLSPGVRFCRNCGAQVTQMPAQAPQMPAQVPQMPGQAPQIPAQAAPPSHSPTVVQPQASGISGPPVQPAYSPPPVQASAWQPPAPASYTPPYNAPAVMQLGATGSSSNLWGPFAGYGTRREHVAWLLEGLGNRAEDLRDTVTQRFNRRQIPQAQMTPVTLTGRGVAVEQRPFYRIERDLATVWLYIARFGEDLYVSQVSYIKGKISLARVLILLGLCGLILLAWLNGALVSVNLQEVVDSFGGGIFGGRTTEPNLFLVGALCCTGPLSLIAQILLIIGFVFSVYKFFTEKDFLVLLRSRPSEFQEDDIVSLEKAVNETVRQAADSIGIDRKLLAPERAYRSDRRLI
ncbi:MAG: zinc-ribbon domain-containing protein [Anaerolineae bacterium]|nr:zinc-ribbon domain-containing protein [Anaerolineae bacterium]